MTALITGVFTPGFARSDQGLVSGIPVVLYEITAGADKGKSDKKGETGVVTEEYSTDPEAEGAGISAVILERTDLTVDSAKLQRTFAAFVARIRPVFAVEQGTQDGFSVDQIELYVEMNASGGFALIGKAEAGLTGGIKVVLKRDP